MKSAYYLLLLILLCSVSKNQSLTFWEFFIGPRLGNKTNSVNERMNNDKTTEQIVRSFGYRLDTHLVASETGHILTLHRIPRGRKSINDTKIRPVAFIHHGLFGCSDMLLLRGPQQDLPYMLADSGYDVWLFNTRGNTYSRKHKYLHPDHDALYWDFGIEDIGYYDVPVTIDYILNITNQEDLFYIGHSIGSSSGFITCILKPEYNKKIRLFLALAPLTNVKHTLTSMHKILFLLSSFLIRYTKSQNIYEILPRRSYTSRLIEIACEDGSPLQKLCLMMIFSIVGNDPNQLNTKTFPRFVQYYPSGTSLKVVSDVIQYFMSGQFASYENKSESLLYDMSKVTAPVSLHYGSGDLLVTEEDIDDLCRRLPNCIGKFNVPHKDFNHLDFVLAINATNMLYNNLLYLMDKYK